MDIEKIEEQTTLITKDEEPTLLRQANHSSTLIDTPTPLPGDFQQLIPEFKTIEQIQAEQVDIPLNFWSEVQTGNFGLVLNYQLPDINVLDYAGYSILHNAVSYNNLEAVKLLLKRGAYIDVKSKFEQTPLVIACNYGFIEIAKALIDHQADIHAIDAYQFTPLLYAIKQKHYSLVFYLVCRGANIHNIKDNNGCSTVHWAAYNNDIFSLRFLKAVGVQINLLDNSGFSPLVRACHNYGYQAVKFICENYSDMLQYGGQPGESKSIKIQMKKQLLKLQLSQNPRYQGLIQYFDEWYQTLLSTSYLMLTFSMMYGLTFASQFQVLTQSQVWFIGSIVFIIGLMYFVLCAIWFIHKTTNTPDQGVSLLDRKKKQTLGQQQEEQKTTIVDEEPYVTPTPQEQEQVSLQVDPSIPVRPRKVSWYQFERAPSFLKGVTIREFMTINYKPVEAFIDTMINQPKEYMRFAHSIHEHQDEIKRIVEISDPLWYESFTIIHLVYFLFETNRFNALHNIDWDRICATCLTYKQPRTYHCTLSKACVKEYHYYSSLYRKSINSTNHLIYFLFQTLQLVVFGTYTTFFWQFYLDQFQSRFYLFYPVEIIYIILRNDGMFITLTYLLVWLFYLTQIVMWLFEVLFTSYELKFYCICLNMTFTELLHNNKYRYLYFPQKIKNGKVYLTMRSRFPYGLIYNIVMYISNQIKSIRLV